MEDALGISGTNRGHNYSVNESVPAPFWILYSGSPPDPSHTMVVKAPALDDGTITYGLLGDEQSAPAIYNEVRADSWISVISAFGGQVFYDEAVIFVEEIRGEVYQ